jgi:hypothetical protein
MISFPPLKGLNQLQKMHPFQNLVSVWAPLLVALYSIL